MNRKRDFGKWIGTAGFFVMVFSFLLSTVHAETVTRSFGDVDGNGQIDETDSTLILQHIAAQNSDSTKEKHPDWILTGNDFEAADTNQNGTIDAGDDLRVKRHISAEEDSSVREKHPDWIISDIFSYDDQDGNNNTPSKPVYYAKPYQKSNIGDIYDGDDFFTMMGKKYYHGFKGEPCYDSWAEYSLDGEYKKMQFSVGHIDNTAHEDATLNLFFDGVLKDQISLTGDMTTITKKIDVKNVNVLRIEIRDAEHVTSYYGFADVVFDDDISRLPVDKSTTNITKGNTVYAIPYQKSSVGDIYKGDDCFEMMGKKYYYGFIGEPCYDSFAQFNLEGNYSSLSYKIGHVDDTADENATLLIELDGVIVDQVDLSGNMKTEERKINVTGGTNLKVQIRDAKHVTSYYAIADMVLK